MFLTIKLFERELIICIKMDLALNNLQGLICHKTQTTKPNNQTNQPTVTKGLIQGQEDLEMRGRVESI